MSNGYKYGVSGQIDKSIIQNPTQAGGAAVYVGTAPVNLVNGYQSAVGIPISVNSKKKAITDAGYSDDWASFTLCEAISAHFDNDVNPVGPIVLINVLDPAVHKKAADTDVSLAFANGKATIPGDTIIVDSLVLDGLVEGVDYAAEYSYEAGGVVITSIGTEITGSVDASYEEVDASLVTATDIIGAATQDGMYTGIHALALVHNSLGIIPTIVAAPGWSDQPAVYRALVSGCINIAGHWCADVYADIPVGSNSDTITEAVAWKENNAYTSEHSKVFWPQATKEERTYHLSTLGVVTRLYVDTQRDGIPFESPANKDIDADGLYSGTSGTLRMLDQPNANTLAQHGITTAVCFGGAWRLWGDHTAAYDFEYEGDIDVRSHFDVNMSMLKYVINDFQERFHADIDQPADKNRIDSIVGMEQSTLDGLKSVGALVGSPTVSFVEEHNLESDIMSGHFCFDVAQTNTPPLKSASVGVAYTDAGIAAIFE
jgi:hypothetical protein